MDQTSTISDADRQNINRMCQRVYDETTGEILICVIPTTGGRNPRQFATNLFNRWGIGDSETDNGILVFVAMQDRKAEIILGDGIDSRRDETVARSVMSDYMMPKFKQGKPSEGIRVAVRECAKRFFKLEDSDVQLDWPVAGRTVAAEANTAHQQDVVAASTEREIEPSNVVAETPFSDSAFDDDDLANLEVAPVAAPNDGQFEKPVHHRNGGGLGMRLMMLLTGGLGAGGTGLGLYHLATRRRKPRNCERCSQPMTLLDEVSDDAHLDSGEQLEEKLGSVDYDVWVCTGCDHALKLRYGKFFSRYRGCPGCDVKASSSHSRTVRAATTMMTGLREVETTCRHCNYHDITQHVIPMVTETSTSSNSFSSGSSFSGGGSSSGGGASGSW